MSKLSKEYQNYIVSSNTLKMGTVLERINKFLFVESIYDKIDKDTNTKLNNLIKQCKHYLGKGYVNKAVYDFDEIFDILQGIAPENCTFGYHEYNGTNLGFWKLD